MKNLKFRLLLMNLLFLSYHLNLRFRLFDLILKFQQHHLNLQFLKTLMNLSYR